MILEGSLGRLDRLAGRGVTWLAASARGSGHGHRQGNSPPHPKDRQPRFALSQRERAPRASGQLRPSPAENLWVSKLLRAATFRARALRRSSTPAEQALWKLLRQRPLGFKFRRQHPKGPFFLDFFCVEAGLVVEVDGWSHVGREARDRQRDEWLGEHGFDVLHLSNEEVLRYPERALSRICSALRRGLPSPFGRGHLGRMDRRG